MEKIKFRAWSKTKQCIINWENIKDNLSNFINNDDYILMQYTGLKDENVKEIYEGDIISFSDLSISFTVAHIYFEKGCFYADDKCPIGNVSLGYLVNNNRNVEVIGNIFENPELLNGE